MPQPIFDAGYSGGSGSTGNGLSWTHTIGAGVTLILVFVTLEWFNNPSAGYTGVTFNGVGMNLIDSAPANTSHPIWCQLWGLWSSIPGAGSYTISCSGDTPSSKSRTGVSASFFSTKPQGPSTNTSHGYSGNSPVSLSVVTNSNNNLVVAGYGSQNGGPATPGGGQIDAAQIHGIAGEDSLADISYQVVPGIQTVSPSITISNPEDEVLIVASFPIQELISGVML